MSNFLRTFIFIFLIVMNLNCGDPNSKLEAPVKIGISLSENHNRLVGTNIHLISPREYKYLKKLGRYQRKESLYFKGIELNIPFNKTLSKFTKKKLLDRGTKLETYKNILVGNEKGIYIEGTSEISEHNTIMIIFGDSLKSNFLNGFYKASDIKGRDELKEIFTTIFYDTSKRINPFESKKFEFNERITGFKFNSDLLPHKYIYSPDGSKEDLSNYDTPVFMIRTLDSKTIAEGEKFAKGLFPIYEKNETKILNKELSLEKINGLETLVIESELRMGESKGVLVQGIMLNKNLTLLFVGITFIEVDKYKLLFRKTMESIKI